MKKLIKNFTSFGVFIFQDVYEEKVDGVVVMGGAAGERHVRRLEQPMVTVGLNKQLKKRLSIYWQPSLQPIYCWLERPCCLFKLGGICFHTGLLRRSPRKQEPNNSIDLFNHCQTSSLSGIFLLETLPSANSSFARAAIAT